KCVKSTLKLANLTALIPQKPCRKLIMKCENSSICGKLNAAVCCVHKKSGKVKSSIVKSATKCKKGVACGASLGFYSTFDACDADGSCSGPTTTTSTTSSTMATTTTTPTSSTTTTTAVDGGAHYTMLFTNGAPGGQCGETDIPSMLTCGGLSIGGGGSTVPEGPTPAGSSNLYQLECALPSGGPCAIKHTSVVPTGIEPDCTD